MSEPTFRPVTSDDTAALVAFLVANQWPFHSSGAHLDAGQAAAQVRRWDLAGDSTRAWWVERDGLPVGLVRVDDLGGPWDPHWDLRIADGHRRTGLGTATVRWLSAELFGGLPGLRRIEAQTRQDNLAMRAVLRRCGYVKEAQYRRAWPDGEGRLHDGIGYAIVREDWESGTSTPVDWDDEPR